ncbi:DUF4185 domain-containing protein [Rhodococcus tukisamuensis]|uniref:DUF4185 domain-containing protein n=1 Tax=Rhodococcus tukisamuensis TaxID=168276 RepID=A0A1G7DX22_9NOCA|nr:protein of unknown function [Rhodococcus tukisamuensis]
MIRRIGAPLCALTLAVTGSLLTGSPATAAPTAAPTNACGETGFDPSAADSGQTTGPPSLDLKYPWPEIVPVPVPDPPQDLTRVPQAPLPVDPCADPCPDLTDPAPEQPDAGSSESSESSGSGSASSSGSSSSGSSGSSAGSSGSGSGSLGLQVPRISIGPDPEPIPIPIPGPAQPLPPAPTPQSPPTEPGPAAPVAPAAEVGEVSLVAQLTGQGSINRTDKRWQVNSTDLGITWESGPGEVSVVFGDTFGKGWTPPGANGSDWRSNVLGHSTDRDLSDGMTIDSMVQDSRCHAVEVLGSRKVKNWETTTIPTSGFAIGDRQYMSYMSVRRWSMVPGMWYTNRGGIAYSDDRGQTWTKDPYANWENLFGRNHFQVASMVPAGDHVYMFGTPNGRLGTVALARAPKDQVLNKSAYQYWVDGTWSPVGEASPTPVMSGTAAELSVRYDAERDLWQMSYLDTVAGAIVLRQADSPQGEWTAGVPMVRAADYPKMYGGFIHPWSTEDDLYFTMSEWDSYNVYLMHAKLN